MKIALTGGIACGKSLAAKFLRELGVQTLDADDIVHELEAPGGSAVPAIATRFGGPSILAADGGVNRVALAERVFKEGESSSASAMDRRDLEAILHPLVRARIRSFLEEGRTGGGDKSKPIRVAVIPLLFESHWESDYDIIVCVSATEDSQISRMMQKRGYTRVQAEARLAAQMPVSEKAARADWTVYNDSTPERLKTGLQRLVAWLECEMERNV